MGAASLGQQTLKRLGYEASIHRIDPLRLHFDVRVFELLLPLHALDDVQRPAQFRDDTQELYVSVCRPRHHWKERPIAIPFPGLSA